MADLEVAAVVAERGLDVAFSAAAGEVLAVVGPNGAGKSTTAAVVAGLLRGDPAVVRVGDRVLTDTSRGMFVPVHDRRVGVLLQAPLLFPHLSVLQNVLFAIGRGARRSAALQWLDRVGAVDLADRRPGELSGGQAQRVALARALAAGPDVLVLDEPLAGLDVAAAAAIRAELRTVLTEDDRAAILITHDLLDVVGLADRVMVLEDGRIADIGRVPAVLAAPRSAFGALLAGVNVVHGTMADAAVVHGTMADAAVVHGTMADVAVVHGTMADAAVLRSGGHAWHGVPAAPLVPGADAVAVFSPAAVAVFRDQPHGSPRNSVRVRIVGLDRAGGAVRIRACPQGTDAPGLAADITPEAVAEIGFSVGEDVWFTVKTQEVGLHAARRARVRTDEQL